MELLTILAGYLGQASIDIWDGAKPETVQPKLKTVETILFGMKRDKHPDLTDALHMVHNFQRENRTYLQQHFSKKGSK